VGVLKFVSSGEFLRGCPTLGVLRVGFLKFVSSGEFLSEANRFAGATQSRELDGRGFTLLKPHPSRSHCF
jgi:hypothetical protein